MSDLKLCPTCGTEYPMSERFCPRDGSTLKSTAKQGDLVGSMIADRYHVIKKLGEGGMGSVYLAEHVKMGRKSAIKVMNPGSHQDADAIARFNREAANASRMNHPNICAIYDFGETPEGLIYLAMEFVEGQSLTDVIKDAGALPGPRAASIIHQAADALQVAHDYGIVHRDLKPDNIMITKNRDGSDLVKVVDFGIAKASSSDAQKVTKTGLVVGTPEYMSPEQLAGDKLDGRSDIYSLALVAFNCFTGTLPFPSDSQQEAMIMRLTDRPKTLGEMRPDLAWPAQLQAVMDRALARDAQSRYASAAEFGRDLAKAVEGMPAKSGSAAEAGTMVIGAQTAAAMAAPAVPATRVATAVDRGAPQAASVAQGVMRAPVDAAPAPVGAAPAKKGSGLLIGGGIGAVAVAAIAGYLVLGPKGAAPGGVQPPTAQTTLANGGGAPGSVTNPGGTATPPVTPTGTRTNPGANPGVTTPNPGTKVPPTGAKAVVNPPPAPVPTVTEDVATQLAHLRTEVEDFDKPNGASVLQRVTALQPKLTAGLDKLTARYVSALAYLKQDNTVQGCQLLKEVEPSAGRIDATVEIKIFKDRGVCP